MTKVIVLFLAITCVAGYGEGSSEAQTPEGKLSKFREGVKKACIKPAPEYFNVVSYLYEELRDQTLAKNFNAARQTAEALRQVVKVISVTEKLSKTESRVLSEIESLAKRFQRADVKSFESLVTKIKFKKMVLENGVVGAVLPLLGRAAQPQTKENESIGGSTTHSPN